MTEPARLIPVVLLAYARPSHLVRVLGCLRENCVPLIHAFADGAKGPKDAAKVAEVRRLLRGVDWCELRLVERPSNLGLGRNLLAGVDAVAAQHEAFIVWEDDLICVPGTYAWMCAALRHYATDARVMSVTGWTHPKVTPDPAGTGAYFDGRAECWVWGTCARVWRGMDQSAREKMAVCEARGVPADAYGADLPRMARGEARKNLWAVRWLYHHLQHGGLCVRPPWSMVEHIGFDAGATNAAGANEWTNPPLRPGPSIPASWPTAVVDARCQALWQAAYPPISFASRLRRKIVRSSRGTLRALTPAPVRARLRGVFGWRWFRGDYRTWAEARAASAGYDDEAIVQKVLTATHEVLAGRAAFERDGVLFSAPDPDRPLLTRLQAIARERGKQLRVLDFGGSLGSNYWRHRGELPADGKLRWDVVEQPSFVTAGQTALANAPVKFFPDVAAATAASPHDVLLCSCVLQYLEDPFRHLAEWSRLEVPYVILNNLPLQARGADRLRVQHVPPTIYPASYPVWFFNREKFLARIGAHYEIIEEFASEAQWPVTWGLFPSTGLWLKRKIKS